MVFSLILVPSVKAYLADLPGFTRTERIRLFTGLNEQLRLTTNAFRADPENRPSPGSPHFIWTFIMPKDSGGLIVIRLFVDDSAAAFGVLRVVYADHS